MNWPVVALVANGLANKEIGSKLFVSEHTMKDHIKNIMRKMSASSRSEIIAILK
jgi:DNA-binding NarL/FixJ family response regulator